MWGGRQTSMTGCSGQALINYGWSCASLYPLRIDVSAKFLGLTTTSTHHESQYQLWDRRNANLSSTDTCSFWCGLQPRSCNGLEWARRCSSPSARTPKPIFLWAGRCKFHNLLRQHNLQFLRLLNEKWWFQNFLSYLCLLLAKILKLLLR